MKRTFFDVEYANSRTRSICQIGIISEDKETGSVLVSESVLVNPEDVFDDACIRVHKITPDMVKDAPTFPEVWNRISKYFDDAVVIGHNVAGADLNPLCKSLKRYGYDIPSLRYVCTLHLAKAFLTPIACDGYGLASVCKLLGIELENHHDALCDSNAARKVFNIFSEGRDLTSEIREYRFTSSDSSTRNRYGVHDCPKKVLKELYGKLLGVAIDNKLNDVEKSSVEGWRYDLDRYQGNKDVDKFLCYWDTVIGSCGVSLETVKILISKLKGFISEDSSADETKAIQVLNGILKGVATDGVVSEEECANLRKWLNDNFYLANRFPFGGLIKLLNEVLEDGVVTQQENTRILQFIESVLNPIEMAQQKEMIAISGKNVCLTGNFAHGEKSAIEVVIKDLGGFIVNSVTKKTNVLLVGDDGSLAYANGTYGSKIKRALELKEKGSRVEIVREKDFFLMIESRKLGTEVIDEARLLELLAAD